MVVTSGGIDDLVIYQGLGVPQVWFWQNHQFSLYYLHDDQYEPISKSEFLPNLDLNVLASFVMSNEKPREIILKFLRHIRKSNS